MENRNTGREERRLQQIWLILLAITLLSASLAEGSHTHSMMAVAICVATAIKGRLVIDHLIGLRDADPVIRASMLSYFYILPPLIALAWLFPDLLARLTTL